MFTGIVSGLGSVVEWRSGQLVIDHAQTASRLSIGASIAVNGACLTAVEVARDTFSADVTPETRRRTNLGSLQAGNRVNLELPVTLDRALDGHLVQGHIDAVSRVVTVKESELGRKAAIGLPAELAGYVAEKGSITVDGISLTVAGIDDRAATFTVALIPQTLVATLAGSYVAGTLVNLEVDIIARYLERLTKCR